MTVYRDDVKYGGRGERLQGATEEVVLADSLTTFLYLLLRDYMPAGKVEMIVREVLTGPENVKFENGFLAKYAANLTDELRDGRYRALGAALTDAFEDGDEVPEQGLRSGVSDDHMDLTPEIQDRINNAYDGMTPEERALANEKLEKGYAEVSPDFEHQIEGAMEDSRDVDEADEPSKRVLRDTKQRSLKTALEAADQIKRLIPNENVEEIVRVLQQEIERDLSGDEQAEESSDGVFRRVESPLNVKDEDIIWSKADK